jgi:hypothetical protein
MANIFSQLITYAFVVAVALWFISVILSRLGHRNSGDVIGGLATLILLAAIGFRTWTWATSPNAADTESEPRSVFGDRLISFKSGLLTDVVLTEPNNSDKYWLFMVGEDALKLGRWFAAKPERAPTGDVSIALKIKVTDKFGNVSEPQAMVLRWTREDWSKVAWETIDADQIIALSDLKLAFPAIRPAVIAWCERNERLRWQACSET